MDDNAHRFNSKNTPYFLKDNETHLLSTSAELKMSMDGVGYCGVSEITAKEQVYVVNNIRKVSQKLGLFGKQVEVYFADTIKDGVVMQWDNNNKLGISLLRYKVDDATIFSPSESLLSAFQKLNNKKTLNFNEEYSIEALFHESVHANSKGLHIVTKSGLDEKIMETCTQLYARERYVKIMKLFNVEAVNYKKIQTNGYGYKKNCNLLRPYFTKDNKLQIGELINIANKTEDGRRIVRKKLRDLGYNSIQIKLLLYPLSI